MDVLGGALQVDPAKCTGCKQCELACSWVQTGTFQPSRSLIRVHVFDEQASYAPYACTQCSEAWCMQACPVNAIDVDERTGAKVVIDEACVGCKLCVIACPFGTIFYDKQTDRAAKCDLCAGDPACAHACPTDAITIADVDRETTVIKNSANRVYRKYTWDDDALVGGILLGPTAAMTGANDVGMLKGLIQTGVRLGPWKTYLNENPIDLRRVYVASGAAEKLLESNLLTGRASVGGGFRFPSLPALRKRSSHHDTLLAGRAP